jgi:hypothetical protein
MWEFFFRVETCTVGVFKAQRSVVQWVKLWWGRLHAGNTDGFMGLSRNQSFTLLETSVTLVGTLRVVPHQTKSVHDHHSHVLSGIWESPRSPETIPRSVDRPPDCYSDTENNTREDTL